MEDLVYFVLGVLVYSVGLYVGGRFTAVEVDIKEMVIVAVCAAVVDLIPNVGWVLSIIVLFYLLKKFTREKIYPDILLLVIVGKLASLTMAFALGSTMAKF